MHGSASTSLTCSGSRRKTAHTLPKFTSCDPPSRGRRHNPGGTECLIVRDVYSHRSAGASCSEAIGPIPGSGSLAYSGLDVITVGIQEERGIVAASALTGGSVVRPTVSEARFVKGNDGFS